VSHGVAFLVGIAIGFVASIVVRVPPIDRLLRDRRGWRTTAHLAAWLVVPVIAAAFMPTFVDAVLVLVGNAIGGAISMLVTVPMTVAQTKRARQSAP
jgi:uncharacterized membrane-anchored protein